MKKGLESTEGSAAAPPSCSHQVAGERTWMRGVRRGGIVGYLLLLVISALLLSTPGGRVPVYAGLCALGVLPALSGRRPWTTIAVVMVLVGAALVYMDHAAGVRFRASHGMPSRTLATPPP